MPNRPNLDLAVLGSTGLPVWHGRVYDEYLTELQGEKGRRALREMSEQDPIIGGILLGVEMLARQVAFTMSPADDTPRAKKIADFIDSCFEDMDPSWEDTLSEVFSMLTYGWAWFEILYKRREGLSTEDPTRVSRYTDGKIGWRGWAIRSQESLHMWEYDKNPNSPTFREIVAMTQLAPPDYQYATIPRAKSLHFKTRSRRQNPEGVSLLRNAYRPWYMKKNIEVIEGIGIERDLAGLPVLWAPANLFSLSATAEEQALFAKLQKLVTDIRRDEQEGILMPMAYDEDKNPQYKLELLSTGGDRQFDTTAVVSRYDQRIAMSMLADFIFLGHESVGSYALSDNKTALFATALGSFLDMIVREINTRAIPKLVLLNGYPLELAPTLRHGDIESADLTKLGDYLLKLSSAGMTLFPNEVLSKYLLGQAGLPVEISTADKKKQEEPPPVPKRGLPEPGQLGQPDLPTGQPKPAGGQVAGQLPPKPRSSSRLPTPSPLRPGAGTTRAGSDLAGRITKINAQLVTALEPQAYNELLTAILTVSKFDELSEDHRALILAAEATG